METSQLIKEAKQGSAAAQKILFEQLSEKMMLVCLRYVKNPQDAEEILLDGFFKFYKTLGSFSFQGDAALYMWLKRMMINECLMFLRKSNVFAMVTENEVEGVVPEDTVFSNLSANEIFKLIVQLPVGYRTVFNLAVVEGLPHREIAQLLNISEGTSKSQLSKSRILLQKMLLQNDIQYVKRTTQSRS